MCKIPTTKAFQALDLWVKKSQKVHCVAEEQSVCVCVYECILSFVFAEVWMLSYCQQRLR